MDRGGCAFNGVIHIFIGLLLCYVCAVTWQDYVFIIVGSLWPDMDHPSSMFRWFNPFKQRPPKFHRGKPHTIIGSALLSTPFIYFGIHAYLFVYMGAMVHILSDWFHSKWHGNKFKVRWWKL